VSTYVFYVTTFAEWMGVLIGFVVLMAIFLGMVFTFIEDFPRWFVGLLWGLGLPAIFLGGPALVLLLKTLPGGN
jgi:hypothetical protein